uniref:Uncharacterized protein n=1 Tax=Candidatus Methanophaga sp. ANME-1 ERB7 TaxID=2759913 RepID=A0A7G9Z1Q4_9EURY|nr:hypothetical protein MOEJAMDC_00001 [Methanosarcinales archaeon ANME-1 ERB7]
MQMGFQRLHDRSGVSYDRKINPYVLSDLCRVDIDVDDLRMRRKRIDLSCNTVIESCADCDQEV